MSRYKLLTACIASLIAPISTVVAGADLGWMWVQYPWAYSANSNAWVYMDPSQSGLWMYDFGRDEWQLLQRDDSTCDCFNNRPTIDSIVGKTIFIETDWVGESFILRKENDVYSILWRTHGSGVYIVKEEVYPVTVASPYQIRFQSSDEALPKGSFKLSMDCCGNFQMYLNGIRIAVNRF
ncbi:MAG: hypothetical protein SFY80_09980 [Verrucomicrobiota bacterium]|nr:hypothetical protein [Verrucomicrobiota bacterium]